MMRKKYTLLISKEVTIILNSTLLEYNSHKAAVMNYIKFKIMKDEKGQMSQKGILTPLIFFRER